MAKQAVKENKASKASQKAPKTAEAHIRYLRISPRKMRLVTNLVKNMYADDALVQLAFANKKAATMVADAIKSAIANAKNNFHLKEENLYIASITCDGGPKLKRFMPRAQGRATPKWRPMSHLNVVLVEKESGKKRTAAAVVPKKEKAEKSKAPEDKAGKVEPKNEMMKDQIDKPERLVKENKVQNKRRLFNRKSGV